MCQLNVLKEGSKEMMEVVRSEMSRLLSQGKQSKAGGDGAPTADGGAEGRVVNKQTAAGGGEPDTLPSSHSSTVTSTSSSSSSKKDKKKKDKKKNQGKKDTSKEKKEERT